MAITNLREVVETLEKDNPSQEEKTHIISFLKFNYPDAFKSDYWIKVEFFSSEEAFEDACIEIVDYCNGNLYNARITTSEDT